MLIPRYYQKNAKEKFFEYTSNNHGRHPLLVLPTGCLSWDSIINESRNKLGRKKRIDIMYKAFNQLNKSQKRNYDKNIKTFVRSFNGERISLNEVESVSYSGIKDLLKLKLENGLELKATPCHRIMTRTGWFRMDELTSEHEIMCDTLKPEKKENHSYIVHYDSMVCNLWFHPYAKKTKTTKDKRGYTLRVEIHRAVYESHINNMTLDEYKRILRTNDEKIKEMIFIDPSIYDIHHKDCNHKNNDPENLIKLTKREHQLIHSKKSQHHFNQGVPKFSKVVSVEYYGKDHTYDIGCFENHNFVANGIVVHNSGKSAVIAMIIEEMLRWDHTKILVLQHSKHLLTQNASELTNLLNDRLLDIGVYSAGLNRRDSRNRILFAGIQSVHSRAWSDVGFRDLILVDECHHISVKSEGMYRNFLNQMMKINPKIVVGGMSATPYRTKGGLLCDSYHKDKIFDDVCYEATIPELINPNHPKNEDKKQYLCPLISPHKAMKSKVDLSKVHIVAGEYNLKEMEDSFNKDDLIERTVKEILSYVPDRKKIIVFCAGIDHLEKVYDTLIRHGQTVDRVHSKRTKQENDNALKKLSENKIKFLLNINSLTEGFNAKDIDCVILMRSTMSPGLYYQMLGRGFRMHESKTDTLVLDFGNNILTHGPVDRIEVKKQKDGTSKVEGVPQKTCPNCESLMFLAVMICPDCGYEFPQRDKHEDQASEADIISKWKKPEIYDVNYIDYQVHQKNGKPDSLRVKYYVSDMLHYDEYVCPMHPGFAARKAKSWLDQRLPVERLDEPLYCIEDIIKNKDKITEPVQIIVDINGKYPQITGYLFEKIEQESENVREAAAV